MTNDHDPSRAGVRRRRPGSPVGPRKPRATAVLSAARQLEECLRRWDDPAHRLRLGEALQNNLRVWALIQIELSGSSRDLLPGLTTALLRLARFVDRLTFVVMADPRPETVQALIDVNRSVAAGLAPIHGPGHEPVATGGRRWP